MRALSHRRALRAFGRALGADLRNVLVGSGVTIAMLFAVACAAQKKSDDERRPAEATLSAATLAPKATCDMIATLGTCSEYRAGTSFGLERSMCDGFKGKFSLGAGACPEQGRIARCAMPGGELRRYYAGPLGVADAKADCESGLVRGAFSTDTP